MKKKVLIGIVGLFVLVVGLTTILWMRFLNTPASPGSNASLVYEVIPGKSFSVVSEELEEKGLVTNAALFTFFAKIRGQASKMKRGEYLLRPSMRPSEVLAVLISGKSIGRNFTIAEGLSIFDVAELVAQTGIATKDEFLKTVEDPEFVKSVIGEKKRSLEGYLFPETYQITKFTDLKSLLKSMVQKFIQSYKEVAPIAKQMGWTRHQVVTLASIVEKETGASSERKIISSVFHNRLKKRMKLQTDPTVLYAKMLRTRNFETNITRLDLAMDDDYNTYRRTGLPPGPIASPGREALLAVVQPAETEYLYFVSRNNGTHVFSESYADHLKAVVKFQMSAKAREGKSWRDLKKESIPGSAGN